MCYINLCYCMLYFGIFNNKNQIRTAKHIMFYVMLLFCFVISSFCDFLCFMTKHNIKQYVVFCYLLLCFISLCWLITKKDKMKHVFCLHTIYYILCHVLLPYLITKTTCYEFWWFMFWYVVLLINCYVLLSFCYTLFH